jgi:3-oxoacyl-[acyl-carrier protein] reductase
MKIALVTGGSRGIGKAVCIKLAAEGYHILINYLSNSDEADNTLKTIVTNGGSGELMQFNVSEKDAVEKAIDQWSLSNPGNYIEVLVNNAGIRKDNLQVFMEDKEWSDVIETNLNGFFFLTRKLLKDMLVKKKGSIVNIVSLSGLKGMPGQTNYSAAKAGVIGATKALAQEVARKNVRVNAVAPGFIKTDMTADLDENELKKLVPMQRFGKSEEVAETVAFLVSEKASYITGQVISVNGGIY